MVKFPAFLVINDNVQLALLQKAVTASIMAAAIENKIHAQTGAVPFINPQTTVEALEDLAAQLQAMTDGTTILPQIDILGEDSNERPS
jgi:hypothetical protein